MSIRFAIKHTASKAEKEGDSIVRFSGVSQEPFNRASLREAKAVGKDAKGDARLVFNTGLDEKKVKFFKWYTEEEQAVIVKQIKEMKPTIADFYGGEDMIKEDNVYFWRDDNEVARVMLTNSSMDIFFDTKNVPHALLYLSIVSGAYIDLIAPTKDWAERHQIPHYLVLETEDTFDEDDGVTRSDAHAALSDLRKEESSDALFILAWCLQYDTNAFGAYLRSTSVKDLVSYHIKYIDGKLVTKRKRDMAKNFLDYAKKWKGQQTRPGLYAEAYAKAGEYYNLIQKINKKFQLQDGSELGGTMNEVIDNLQKAKFSQDLEKLRDLVEAKWKE